MAQHDYVIANDTAANVRADINTALLAIASNNSGASAPSTTYANQWWYDASTDTLKIRSEANDAWISVAVLDQTNDQFLPIIAGTSITGMSSQAVAEAGTDNATLMTPLRVAQAIDAQAAGLTADVQEFTSSGTWTKPANAKLVYVEIWGGGGGGGSGRRDVNTATVGGGGGGGGAAGVFYQFRASELTSTVSVTIGAGGAGGAAVTVNATNGNVGSAGGDSTFGSFLTGKGGGAGGAGVGSYNTANGGAGSGWAEIIETLTNGSAGSTFGGVPAYGGRSNDVGNAYNYNLFGGASGGSSYSGAVAAGGGDIAKPGTGAAGGGGGGCFNNTTLSNAGIGGVRWGTNIPQSPFQTGVGLGVNGAAGAAFGDGGGGGGHGRTANAGNGGAGNTAAGGGGGGGSANGFTSGAGGAGGNGFCRVTTYS